MSLLAGEIHPIVESSCAVVLVNAPSVVSTEIIESLVTDGKEAWGQLGRELEDVGISVTLLTRHR
jgi:actin-like ATPase involved in cell morphogenesis